MSIEGKSAWQDIIRVVLTGYNAHSRYTVSAPQGIVGHQSIQIDLKDNFLEETAERIIGNYVAQAEIRGRDTSLKEQKSDKTMEEVERKANWIGKSANAVAEARANERELTQIEFITLINTYFTEHISDEAGIREDLIGLILKATKRDTFTLITREEIENMTGL